MIPSSSRIDPLDFSREREFFSVYSSVTYLFVVVVGGVEGGADEAQLIIFFYSQLGLLVDRVGP